MMPVRSLAWRLAAAWTLTLALAGPAVAGSIVPTPNELLDPFQYERRVAESTLRCEPVDDARWVVQSVPTGAAIVDGPVGTTFDVVEEERDHANDRYFDATTGRALGEADWLLDGTSAWMTEGAFTTQERDMWEEYVSHQLKCYLTSTFWYYAYPALCYTSLNPPKFSDAPNCHALVRHLMPFVGCFESEVVHVLEGPIQGAVDGSTLDAALALTLAAFEAGYDLVWWRTENAIRLVEAHAGTQPPHLALCTPGENFVLSPNTGEPSPVPHPPSLRTPIGRLATPGGLP